jgi:hypothetical protein
MLGRFLEILARALTAFRVEELNFFSLWVLDAVAHVPIARGFAKLGFYVV